MKIIPVVIEYSDGMYSMYRIDVGGYWSDRQADLYIPEPLWEAYNDFAFQAHLWHRILCSLDNQAYEDKEKS